MQLSEQNFKKLPFLNRNHQTGQTTKIHINPLSIISFHSILIQKTISLHDSSRKRKDLLSI